MTVTVTYNAKWQIIESSWYKWTDCKKLINCKSGKEVRKVMKGNKPGYYINRKFIPLMELRKLIELIPDDAKVCPF